MTAGNLYAKPATGSTGVVTIKNSVAFGNGKLTNGEGSAKRRYEWI